MISAYVDVTGDFLLYERQMAMLQRFYTPKSASSKAIAAAQSSLAALQSTVTALQGELGDIEDLIGNIPEGKTIGEILAGHETRITTLEGAVGG